MLLLQLRLRFQLLVQHPFLLDLLRLHLSLHPLLAKDLISGWRVRLFRGQCGLGEPTKRQDCRQKPEVASSRIPPLKIFFKFTRFPANDAIDEYIQWHQAGAPNLWKNTR